MHLYFRFHEWQEDEPTVKCKLCEVEMPRDMLGLHITEEHSEVIMNTERCGSHYWQVMSLSLP